MFATPTPTPTPAPDPPDIKHSPKKEAGQEVLPAALRIVLGLAAVSAAQRPPAGAEWFHGGGADAWLANLLHLLDLERDMLPCDVEPEDVARAASDRGGWSDAERERIAKCLIQAALLPEETRSQSPSPSSSPSSPKSSQPPTSHVAYSPVARAVAHRTLALLGLDSALLPRVEAAVGAGLAAALELEGTERTAKSGWRLGRGFATGAGVVVGGVLIGVTGGLAAPALAGFLAPLGLGTVLSATAAPMVLGALFGLTGGGLAGWSVERWWGIDEFGFVEVSAGTRPSEDEVDDLRGDWGAENEDEDEEDAEARREVARVRAEVLGRLADSESAEGKSTLLTRHPTLTATIVVSGLLKSRTEALAAWRAVCSPTGALPSLSGRATDDSDAGSPVSPHSPYSPYSPYSPLPYTASDVPTGLKDGRDVFVLRCESAAMLATGREVEAWAARLPGDDAAALPLTVDKAATSVDSAWTNAQGTAVKAGRLLGDVLAQRVQGERPVVLIGTSVGALTVLHALQHLATLSCPPLVESAFLISLPSSPTDEEWAAARRVTARRLVNAWSDRDFVLAAVGSLHDAVRGIANGKGADVAGLGPVRQRGVEDVDVSDAVGGHLEINARIAEVLELIEIDE